MPKHITHWILAEKIYQAIEGDSVLKKIINYTYALGENKPKIAVMDLTFYILISIFI